MLYTSGAIRPCSEDEIKEYEARLAAESAERLVLDEFEELRIKYDALLVQNLSMNAELEVLRAVAARQLNVLRMFLRMFLKTVIRKVNFKLAGASQNRSRYWVYVYYFFVQGQSGTSLSVSETKVYLRISADITTFDGLVLGYITNAHRWAERETNRLIGRSCVVQEFCAGDGLF